MMRQFRRAWRQWQGELDAFWGRFSTFHRLVLGILLAMGIVYGARRQILDERRAAVASLQKELADQDVPAAVPSPETDDDVQEAQLQAESLESSLERERRATRAVIEQRRAGGRTEALETIEALGRLIGKHGLVVRTATRVECEGEFPVPRVCQSYHLVGDFAGIHGFLREVNGLGTPCGLRNVAVSIAGPDAPGLPGKQAPLALTFQFESLYVE